MKGTRPITNSRDDSLSHHARAVTTIVLMSFSLVPGLIYMWLFAPWTRRTKILVTLFSFVAVIAIIIFGLAMSGLLIPTSTVPQISRSDKREAQVITMQLLQAAQEDKNNTGTYPGSLSELLRKRDALTSKVFRSTTMSYHYEEVNSGQDCRITVFSHRDEIVAVYCSDVRPDDVFNEIPVHKQL
jgi:hypothetical protein